MKAKSEPMRLATWMNARIHEVAHAVSQVARRPPPEQRLPPS